jgi:glyoxylase-like metal-dependent hydrolase (beta-lactamase superfamily II)
MATSIEVGNFKITALSDGEAHMPKMFYPGVDFDAHPEMVDTDGTYHIPAVCFLIQGEGFTVLVDAGNGQDNAPFPAELAAAAGLEPGPQYIAVGGKLPDSLAAAGVAPEDITTLFLTHLHPDHVGWVAPGGVLFFPNAEIFYGAADWDALIAPAPAEDPTRMALEAAKAAGVLRAIDGTAVEIVPGITAHLIPGHTPGHYSVAVTSGGQEAHLLGDAVHHPLQLNDTAIYFVHDADAKNALETREELFTQFEGTDAAIGMTHFPGMDFKRITVGDRREWTNA